MWRNLLFFAFFPFISSLPLRGQAPGPCGTSETDARLLLDWLLRNKTAVATLNLTPRNATVFVPVTFHLVADADGTGRAAESDILDMLCQVNAIYQSNFSDQGQSMQFYIKSIQYINNHDLYAAGKSSKAVVVMANNKVTDALNVYTVNSMGGGSEGVLGYYAQGDVNYTFDWVVLVNGQANGANASTAAHEFGHVFSLLHTFNGWESGGYATGTCAPVSSPGGIATEMASRDAATRNCDASGDYLCDTPPDYNFGFGATTCTFNDVAKDAKCAQVHPDILNLMGYFIGCESKFSTQQKQVMLADYNTNPYRQYLRGGAPDKTEIATAPLLAAPANAANTPYSDYVAFNWSAVGGASNYLLEISPYQTFIVNQHFFISPKNTQTVSNRTNPGTFLANKTYYWRVKPFSPYKTCGSWSAVNSFKTGSLSGTEDVPGLSDFEVYPNPVSNSRQIHCTLTTAYSIKGKFRLFDMAGRQVKVQDAVFSAGTNSEYMNVEDLSGGFYLLSFESGNGAVRKKIILTP